jgi:hypothetical protein
MLLTRSPGIGERPERRQGEDRVLVASHSDASARFMARCRPVSPIVALGLLASAAALSLLGSSNAIAQRVENGTAVFAALDKVTARISRIEVKLNETATFGALKVTPRTCYSRPPTEQPKTTTFVEVDEIMLDGKSNRIFNGWMFAESPALNAVEHPVYDIWLTECVAPVRPGVAANKGAPAKGVGRLAPSLPLPAAGNELPPAEDFRRRRPR